MFEKKNISFTQMTLYNLPNHFGFFLPFGFVKKNRFYTDMAV